MISVFVLVILGLFSGLASAMSWNSSIVFYLPGIIFGIAFALFFVSKDDIKVIRALGFTLATTVIWPFVLLTTSLFAFVFTLFLSRWIDFMMPPSPFVMPFSVIFGGAFGAFLVTIAFRKFFFQVNEKGLKIISLAGGILGIVGYEVGFLIFGNSDSINLSSIFVVWQTGMAVAFAILVYFQKKK
jgi:hypothetical protein